MDMTTLKSLSERLKDQIARVIIGQEEVVESILVGLLCEGHLLLEGPPGTAKTLLARAFAHCLKMEFNRIQFTPDLMPGDVVGTNLFNFQTNTFSLTKGPVFTDFLLADEINRTPPKTQAALLQAMQERCVTIDGTTYELSKGFMVVATQNPIEQEGTYPLPEAQLDRFLFKALVGFPSRDEECEVVRLHGHRTAMPNLEDFHLEAIADIPTLMEARRLVSGLRIAEEVIEYVVDLVRATREHHSILHGASPRAANMLATAARALAAMHGREFVIPDDVKSLYRPTMRHRIILSPEAEVEGLTPDAVLEQIQSSVPAPR
jgi:MoxR-like ATPase